jgi:nitroimidazol reductase NimA-like FMN-containing flavoprotein (pyridoxamine 5'-phosphate oxidase superfamily)
MSGHSPDAADVMPLKLSKPEIDELLEQRLIGNLASIDPDGSVYLVAIWFRRDGDRILMPTSHHTRKARNLRERPAATLMIDASGGGLDLKGVIVRGDVKIIGGEEARQLNRSVHLRYIDERAFELEPVAAYFAGGDDITLALSMDRVGSWNLANGEAGRALGRAGLGLPLDG